MPTPIFNAVETETATIALNGTISGAVVLGGRTPVALAMPAALTSTTMTFQVSYDGTNYVALYDTSGSAVSITVAASRNISLSDVMAQFLGAVGIKLVGGSAEGAARSIGVVMRPLA